MGKYRFFKIGEEVQNIKGIEIIDDYIIEVQPEFYPDDFTKLVKKFNKPITNLKQADTFIRFLIDGNYVLSVNFLEYWNVIQ